MKQNEFTGARDEIRLMTLNPGHFHAALVQKSMMEQVHPVVHIYAPEGPDVTLHEERMQRYNTRPDNPTRWELKTYTGPDYLKRMIDERPGNVMITAGNNRLKTEYIKRTVDAGINVLSDKPMAIDKDGWKKLVEAFELADRRGVLLYDIMPERKEITCELQRSLARNKELFGSLKQGTPDDPAIVKESVHHLFKMVSGYPLQRPPWYFDVKQQGEGIVDVTIHLVDLVFWGAFPDQIVDYKSDVQMLDADRWPTKLSLKQYEKITGQSEFPDFLHDQVTDGVLPYYCNGDILFTANGIHSRVCVKWDYQAPEGGGDTHFSTMRGTQTELVIRQGKEQNYKATLYVECAPETKKKSVENAFKQEMDRLQKELPGISYKENDKGWELSIPDKYYLGHETHYQTIAREFYEFLVSGQLPHWEVPNMISRYYVTTQAREIALNKG